MISTITALKTKLYVAKLADDRLADCSHALMRQLFFPKHETQNRFFSFTRSSQETSLILEEGALADFPPFSLTIVKTQWRALSVSLGSVGYTGTGIVSSLSGLLAKAAQKIDQAIAALKSSFTIYAEGDLELDEEEEEKKSLGDSSGEVEGGNQASSSSNEMGSSRASTPSVGTGADVFESLQQNTLEMQGSSEIFKLSADTPPCTLLHDELRLCHIEMEQREICAFAILKLMFFTAERDYVWSISETEDEMSLLIPDKFLNFFPPDALNASEIWRPIQRFRKTSYTEVGVVAALSAPLARGRIPLLYISTYLSAFILVQSKNVNAATICLQSSKFQVTDQHAQSLP